MNKLIMVGMLDIKGNECIRRVYSTDGICPALTTMAGGNRQPKVLIKKKPKKEYRACLTPERINKSQNGRRFKDVGEPMFTLTTQDKHGVLEIARFK